MQLRAKRKRDSAQPQEQGEAIKIMKPERWHEITRLFHEARTRDDASRTRFLDEACGWDRALRDEVEAMLEAHDAASQFGETPAVAGLDVPTPVANRVPAEPSPLPSRRAPWWMYVVAASYIALLALIPYLVIWGPADLLGLVADFEDGTILFRTVEPDSLPAKAGLRAGDRLVAIDGRLMHGRVGWRAVNANLEVGRTQRWQILRDKEPLEFEVTPERATWQNRLAGGYVSYTALVLSSFAVGLFIGFRRPGDPVGRIGGWFIATSSIAFGLPNGWAVAWRQVPLALQAVFWIPEIGRFVLDGIFLSLFVIFPRRMFRARWLWIAIWVPVVATLPWRLADFYAVIYDPGQASGVPAWVNQAAFLRAIVYLVAGAGILVLGYHRLLDPNEKRRVRVLVMGTATGAAAAIANVWVFNFSGLPRTSLLFNAFVHPLILACPLAFAYAILRHRVFDIHVIIRQGLQYALARGAVIGIVPVLGAFFVLDLALNSQEPLAAIMQSRGWIYAGLSGLALLTYWKRKPWIEAIDRRFFRERYNAQRVLRDVVEEIREARSFERVASRVVARIETALHPEFVSLLVRQPDEPEFRALASFPSEAILSIPADSKLAALVRALEKPVGDLLSSSSWLENRLPLEECHWVRRMRIDLVVPVAMAAGRKEALLALGIKRSEEPYTREDQELLEAIASSLGLLLEQTGPAGKPAAETFEECPECGVCYGFNSRTCSVDGAALASVHLSRTLVGRYRLERRRGRGGMGTVYEAIDNALERRVAIKVIRDDYVGSVEAAQRFKREARAAAGFVHPNVVTVYDYGVEGGTRGFLVMELLEGLSLRDELHVHKTIDAVRTLGILRGVCAAVEAAHRRQLIHRDLKPENIFLARADDETGEVVKILDFGIAKFLGPGSNDPSTQDTALTHTGILVGTPAYMSPEQLIGKTAHLQWDLWALAVVAYEMVTGALPFQSTSPNEWRNAVLSGQFTPLDRHLPNPSRELNAFFVRSFDTDPTKRPAAATQFFHQLQETLSVQQR